LGGQAASEAAMGNVARVGLGYDLHRLADGRKLVLAGVEVPFEKGLLGHSDADVVLHALIDALLGAAGLSDIGEQFPDSDPAYKDISSSILLARTMRNVESMGYAVVNVDVTILLERPKLRDYKPLMRQHLAQWLGVEVDAVSVKAKTSEGLGEVGTSQAVACQAIVGLRLT
jgi:2-C-methyl-D-erythritol 2,4-cyclodiphosphate synthase